MQRRVERRQRAPRRGGVRRLRVVDVADAVDARARARAGAATPGNVRSASAIASSPSPRARAAAVAAAAFSRLCAPGMQRLGGQLVVGGELDASPRARDRPEAARHDGDVVRALVSKIRSLASR